MKKYLVGGAVRDRFIPAVIKDHDWVWVGATPQDMIDFDFKQVGADFPVFLDDNGEEHALARTERKTGPGYNGFETQFDPSITIEDDLMRRDLTINAMAICVDDNPDYLDLGEPPFMIIDPFNGRQDIRDGILRHVSDAFREDPVRILRVARFAARYNFQVHPDTMELMKEMVRSGEVDNLTKERVWSEFSRAIQEDYPRRFFEVMVDCQALHRVAPDVWFKLQGIQAVDEAAMLGLNEEWQRWVALFCNNYEDEGSHGLETMGAPTDIVKRVKMIENFLDVVMNPSVGEVHNFMRKHRLSNWPMFETFQETVQILPIVCRYINHREDVTSVAAAIREAGRVWADTIISRFPEGEAPRGKELGDAIRAEEREIISKYFDEEGRGSN